MPIDKRATLRYRILNSCFNNRQKPEWTTQELLDKFRDHDIIVDQRTLERDFEAMRHNEQLNYKAPICYNRRHKTFYYSDKKFTINKLPITADDLQPFIKATLVLQQYKGLPFVKQFEGVVDKLGKIVNQLDEPDTKEIIAFEECAYYKGHDHVDAIANAIINKVSLKITYEKFNGAINDHIFHPYFLKEYRGRWYVLGHSETRHYTITLGLDRIAKIEQLTSVFKENKTIKQKQQHYFKHTLGVTIGKGPVELIELEFSPTLAPYIKTQHIHHTQRTIHDDANGLTISLKLIPNPELLQLILSYGADVKVIGPLTLKQHVKATLDQMAKWYRE